MGLSRQLPAPLRIPAFRFQFTADLATSCAFEMEALILAWFILVETGSVLLLSVFAALQSMGTLCAPFFGLGAERIGTRRLLAMMRASYSGFAGTLMLCAWAGWLTPTVVLVLATLMGLVRPSDIAMRSLLVSELMPPEGLMQALSLSRMTQDLARTTGALTGAGLFTALGMGPAYVAVVGLYLLAFTLTLRVPATPPRTREGPRPSPIADIKEGFAYARATPVLLAALLLAFLVNFTAYPLSGGLLAYIARDVYGLDQTGLGTLSAAFALGGLTGSLALSLLGGGPRVARLMIAAALIWHALLLGFVHANTLVLGVTMLALAGFVQNLCMIPMQLVILRNAELFVRGRVMGLRMLAIYGLPVGLMLAGWLTNHLGFATTGTLYCLTGACATLAIGLKWRHAIRRAAAG